MILKSIYQEIKVFIYFHIFPLENSQLYHKIISFCFFQKMLSYTIKLFEFVFKSSAFDVSLF